MKTDTKISKRLSFWLRHKPEDAGLILSDGGWAAVADVLDALRALGLDCKRDQLERVVATNDKKRFEFSKDGKHIRARQGHSIDIELGLTALQPPEFLFHGTATRFLPPILAEGLKPMARHHVHLSPDRDTAHKVGSRHGKPAILQVAASAMQTKGHTFYRTENGVWLTDAVPAHFLALNEARPK
ncbi:RNA 2'-phosphotransferase [Labrenzia sp. THAF191b]|uniref:RNA 2'-phosphotransferase n=1 Tax=unclassified Labrenzia TaxID=2648686 RepID=UPI001268ABF0|nr:MULTISPECIES: RNA 2'-phosphotransferase [unclassified Labrenzia]QFS98587.1 RNA 2'-phosphotransferase [Labrenzia sp. THAF191b]QFT04901.1 RNA 2'-phosphotransferase [Labrenzia sp. THAF191a]QFT16445.1 RNA 2'-phosphotransferase [Labrenzia sp. THAF187b]